MKPSHPTARRAYLLAAALLLLLVPLFLYVPPHLRQDPLIGPVADRYHVVLFAVLAVVLHRWGLLKGRPVAVIATCLALGAATELLQQFTGRSASVWDWYQDALGTGLGACWIWWRRSGRRAGPLLVTAGLLALVAWPLRHLPVTVTEARAAEARFPLLDDFERPDALVLWSAHNGGDLDLVATADRGGVLQLTNDDATGRWPGVSSRHLPWNWAEQDTLWVTCRLCEPSPDSLLVSVWLEDRVSASDSDYVLVHFPAGRDWRTFAVPLTDTPTRRYQRALAREEIIGLSVFMHRKQPGKLVMQLDDVRLGGG